MRAWIAAIATVLVFSLAAGATASAAVFRGSASDDPKMAVKLTLSAGAVTFEYSDVLTGCSDGSQVRQGGAVHETVLNELGKFKDTLAKDGVTSTVRGKLGGARATGVVHFEFAYDGGECNSEKVEWKARRK